MKMVIISITIRIINYCIC